MKYTKEEEIEILEAKKQDRERLIKTAFNEEAKAKLRIEIRRIDQEIEILKALLKAHSGSVHESCYRKLEELRRGL